MTRLFMAVATGLYIGRLPWAPATVASIGALLPWLLIKDLPLHHYLAVLTVLVIVGFFCAGAAEKILDRPNAEPIVIDEITGMLVTLTLAPHHPLAIMAGLILFRFNDTFKPWPIAWINRHIHGGIGIMADDIVAGIYAFCCLQLLRLAATSLI